MLPDNDDFPVMRSFYIFRENDVQ